MKNIRFRLPLSLVVAAFLASATVSVAAAKEQAMKVGKKGDITFSTETTIGDLTLPAGNYRVQHRVHGAEHFIHFEALTNINNSYHQSSPGVKGHPGEVQCRLEPLNAKVHYTTVYSNKEDGTSRVTKVEIGGETVAHIF